MTVGTVVAVIIGTALAVGILPLLDAWIGHMVTGLPWYPRYFWKKNRDQVLAALIAKVKVGRISAATACEAFKQTIGLYHLKSSTAYIHAIYDAARDYQDEWQRSSTTQYNMLTPRVRPHV